MNDEALLPDKVLSIVHICTDSRQPEEAVNGTLCGHVAYRFADVHHSAASLRDRGLGLQSGCKSLAVRRPCFLLGRSPASCLLQSPGRVRYGQSSHDSHGVLRNGAEAHSVCGAQG